MVSDLRSGEVGKRVTTGLIFSFWGELTRKSISTASVVVVSVASSGARQENVSLGLKKPATRSSNSFMSEDTIILSRLGRARAASIV